MSAVFNVLIIGAGKIGALFDAPKDTRVLTYAHAFTANPRFRLAGFVDADILKARHAAGVWGGAAFSSVADVFKLEKIDVAVIATPDVAHAAVLDELSRYPLKLVCVEKPLAKTKKEAGALGGLYKSKGLPVLVNYSRRFVKEFRSLREKIASGAFGKFMTGTGYYGKGLLHNGSHMVDLVRFLLGEVKGGEISGSIVDFFDDDPSVSACLKLESGQDFFLHALDARIVTVFEMDLFFEAMRVRIVDSGFSIEESVFGESPVYSGYQVLLPGAASRTSLDRAMVQVVENIEGHLLHGDALLCGIDDGYKAVEICTDLAQQAGR